MTRPSFYFVIYTTEDGSVSLTRYSDGEFRKALDSGELDGELLTDSATDWRDLAAIHGGVIIKGNLVTLTPAKVVMTWREDD